MAIKIIHTKNLRWVDITNPKEEEIDYLKNNFRFHPLDFEDITTPSTRPKIDEYDEYHFIILLFPLLNRETIEITPSEVDFFVGKDFLVTVHDGKMRTLTNLVQNVSQFDNVRNQYMEEGSGFLLFSILELLFKRSFPILDQINRDMEDAQNYIFELSMDTLKKFSHLKQNIITYRRMMKMHKFVLTKLMRKKRDYLRYKDSKIYLQNLIEYAENIWDGLSSDKETLESYESTNQSFATHHTNDILRMLTVFSVIIFVLTLIINTLTFVERATPLNEVPYLLPMVFSGLTAIALLLLAFFKNRKWL